MVERELRGVSSVERFERRPWKSLNSMGVVARIVGVKYVDTAIQARASLDRVSHPTKIGPPARSRPGS